MWTVLLICAISLTVSSAQCKDLNFNARFGASPAPFEIDVKSDFIQYTKRRISESRLPNDIEESEYQTGPPRDMATAVRAAWVHGYDWFSVQKELNEQFTQYTTSVDISTQSNYTPAVRLHYVHHQSPREDAIPLLFIHGWPGSFLEVGPLIQYLTHPPNSSLPAFHVVAPSIPGFGFSPAPTHTGFGYIETAHSFNALMLQLNYDKYVVQGGDAGGIIMRYQAHLYPNNVVSGLNNFWVVSPSQQDRDRYNVGKGTPDEVAVIERLDYFVHDRWGYGQIQQTRPLRLAYALTDSPIGLAMWIYDALWPAVENRAVWTPHEIITWTMMHWIQGPYHALRIYREGAKAGAYNATHFHDLPYVTQPIAISEFPNDMWYRTPLEWAQRTGNVTVRYMHDYGGHFPAWETPAQLARDVWLFFGNEQLSGTGLFRVLQESKHAKDEL